MSVTVTAGDKSLPLCSYPTYPRYNGGRLAQRARTNAPDEAQQADEQKSGQDRRHQKS